MRRYGSRGSTLAIQEQPGLLDDMELLDYLGLFAPLRPTALLGDPFLPSEAEAADLNRDAAYAAQDRINAVKAGYVAPKVRKKTGTKAVKSKYIPPKDTFLDLSNLSEVPDVEQKALPRRKPTPAAKQRFEPYVTRETMNRMNRGVEEGLRLGGMEWFNTNPLRQAFIDEFGPELGEERFRQYIQTSAAMSARSGVAPQIKRGQYFYNRFIDDPETAFKITSDELKSVGAPGHLAHKAHMSAAPKILYDQLGPNDPQKMLSYSQNLLGNYEPVTADVHNVRLFTGKNPVVEQTMKIRLKPGESLPDEYKGMGRGQEKIYEGKGKNKKLIGVDKKVAISSQLPDDYFENMGRYVSPDDARVLPADATAYAILEQPQAIEARRMGIAPAQYQAAAWLGGGKETGLSSVPEPFLATYDRMLRESAEKQGMSPGKLLKQLIRGKGQFLAIPLAGLAALQSLYSDEPESLLD